MARWLIILVSTLVFSSCGDLEEIFGTATPNTETGSCTNNLDFSASGGGEYKLCTYYNEVETGSENELKTACEAGDDANNTSAGTWSDNDCDTTDETASCTDGPISNGTISVHVYNAFFNKYLKEACEGGSSMFSNGAGTFTEITPPTLLSARFKYTILSTLKECKNLTNMAPEIKDILKAQWTGATSEGITAEWTDDATCESTDSAIATCIGATSEAGFQTDTYIFDHIVDESTSQSGCESEGGTFTVN